jgi:hypothetical protein
MVMINLGCLDNGKFTNIHDKNINKIMYNTISNRIFFTADSTQISEQEENKNAFTFIIEQCV